MQTQTISYEHHQVKLEAFAAFDPNIKGKKGTILIFPSWKGRDEFVCKKAEELAKLGYMGIAIDLYGKGVVGSNKEENAKLMQPLIDDRQLLQDRMLIAMEAAATLDGVDKNNLGVIGFCFGGLCALDLARSGVGIKGTVSFHGLLNAPSNANRGHIKSKIIIFHGHEDPMVPESEVSAFQKEMTQDKVDWQFVTYGNAMHAFTNPAANDVDLGTVYHAPSDKRSWQAMQNFFAEVFA